MKKYLIGTAVLALLVGCNSDQSSGVVKLEPITATSETKEKPIANGSYDLKAQFNKFAPVKMNTDTSFLSDNEKAVVNKLIEASRFMNDIYMRQLNPDNPKIRRKIAGSDLENKSDILRLFNLHYGVCDGLAEGHIFFGDEPCSEGAGFYPSDMTKQEFEDWIAAHPEDEAAFRSGYTIIRRQDETLIAVPYSEAFKGQLTKAATILRDAADLSEEPTLQHFLRLRADAFLSDDYFESEMAWMDLKGNIEIAIGPYEVYDDQLFGYKTAFESFVTVKNPEESAALAKYKNYLRDMEANLPVDENYKNFKRGFESPIAVTYQVQGGGDNVPGVQTIAFNLPNDERVREAKGAKKVILNNVLGAKYDRILTPIAKKVLVKTQADMTAKKHMAHKTLFHELSHSLGPGSITVNGVETSVSAELKELYTKTEEGKADILGAYNVLYMMQRGELPVSEKENYLATHFAGLFRSMRFGIASSHATGAAIQYNFFRQTDAVTWLSNEERFQIDFGKMEQAISDLAAKFIMVQGDGDYDQAQEFLNDYARLDFEAKKVLSSMDDIPVDIRPLYPRKI